jgi:hypothetical protein
MLRICPEKLAKTALRLACHGGHGRQQEQGSLGSAHRGPKQGVGASASRDQAREVRRYPVLDQQLHGQGRERKLTGAREGGKLAGGGCLSTVNQATHGKRCTGTEMQGQKAGDKGDLSLSPMRRRRLLQRLHAGEMEQCGFLLPLQNDRRFSTMYAWPAVVEQSVFSFFKVLPQVQGLQ